MLFLAALANETTEKMEQIAVGFFRGALHAEGFDDIIKCVQDAEGVVEDAEAAYKDFKAGGLSNMAAGFQELAKMMLTLQDGMSDCSHLEADWKKIEAMATAFKTPASFAYHVGKDLLLNGVDIYHEIKQAVSDYDAQNWDDFGFQIGEASAKIFVGVRVNDEATMSKMEQIAVGFFRGALQAEGFDDIIKCVQDGVTVVEDAEAAYKDFKAGGLSNIAAGFQELASMMLVLKNGMSDCANLKADWKEIEAMATAFSTPSSFAYHVGKDLLLNGVDIYHEIKQAVSDYDAQNWDDFGFQVGEASAKVFVGVFELAPPAQSA